MAQRSAVCKSEGNPCGCIFMMWKQVVGVMSALAVLLAPACTDEPEPAPESNAEPKVARIDLTDDSDEQKGEYVLPVLRDPTPRTDDELQFMFSQAAVIPLPTHLDIEDWQTAAPPVAQLDCPHRDYRVSFPTVERVAREGMLCSFEDLEGSTVLMINDRIIEGYRIGSGPNQIKTEICLADLFADAVLFQTTSYFCGADFLRLRVKVFRETQFSGMVIAQSANQLLLEVRDDDPVATSHGNLNDTLRIHANRSTFQTGLDCGISTYPCDDAKRAEFHAEHRNRVARILGESQ